MRRKEKRFKREKRRVRGMGIGGGKERREGGRSQDRREAGGLRGDAPLSQNTSSSHISVGKVAGRSWLFCHWEPRLLLAGW